MNRQRGEIEERDGKKRQPDYLKEQSGWHFAPPFALVIEGGTDYGIRIDGLIS